MTVTKTLRISSKFNTYGGLRLTRGDATTLIDPPNHGIKYLISHRKLPSFLNSRATPQIALNANTSKSPQITVTKKLRILKGATMARVNIEDSLYKDFRFLDLVTKMGSVDTALGALVRAWTLAQKYFLTTDNDRLIPLDEWQNQRIPDAIIEVGLAEKRSQGIYLHGAEKQFSWLLQRSKAGKTKKPKKKKRPLTPDQRPLTDVERNETEVNGSERLETSLLFSPFSNLSFKELKAPQEIGAHIPEQKIPTFIATYVKAYQARYGENSRPSLPGKEIGQIKAYVTGKYAPPLERACALIQVYLQLDGERGWFKSRYHDFQTFRENLNQISIALDTGNIPSKQDEEAFWARLASKEKKNALG